MSTFKKVFYILITIIIFALISSLIYFKSQNKRVEKKLDIDITNEKAFIAANS